MQDARYLRAQAKLCLDVVARTSNRVAKEKLEIQALEYLKRAEEIEVGTFPSPLEF